MRYLLSLLLIFLEGCPTRYAYSSFTPGPKMERSSPRLDTCIQLFEIKGRKFLALEPEQNPYFIRFFYIAYSNYYYLNQQMFSIISDCAELLTNIIAQIPENEDVNIHERFQALTLDVISRCAFALDLKCQENSQVKEVNFAFITLLSYLLTFIRMKSCLQFASFLTLILAVSLFYWSASLV